MHQKSKCPPATIAPPNMLVLVIVTAFAVANPNPTAAHQERFTSVEELEIWPAAIERLEADVDSLIAAEEIRLESLQSIRRSLKSLRREEDNGGDGANRTDSDASGPGPPSSRATMTNPVNVFVLLNRIRRVVENLDRIFDDNEIVMERGGHELTFSEIKVSIQKLEHKLPLHEDFEGAGQALLRLQAFYNLNISKLIDGQLGASYRMDALDCFEMGKFAYDEAQYAPAIVWLFSAMQRSQLGEQAASQHKIPDETIPLILDYMSFAAYKLGYPDYAAKLTEAWLETDPENERARENLLIYYEELTAGGANSSASESAESLAEHVVDFATANTEDFQSYQPSAPIDEYQVGDDEIVKRLCLQSASHTGDPVNVCQLSRAALVNGLFFPGLKVETLSRDPRIIRLHDIVSKEEAAHLRNLAKPNLQRSTIMSSKGLRASDYRIAKTAWLRGDSDPIVERVERRLGSVLNLSMHKSELLQVVNYGLGGFYGPHMDSARVSSRKGNDSLLADQLDRSDRLATILIYLSRAEAGGATVFPRLNLTVGSLERSAVVWFNILENGYSDERTLHTGCPVLLGTKWIATKWPHEEANTFRRRCKPMIDFRGDTHLERAQGMAPS